MIDGEQIQREFLKSTVDLWISAVVFGPVQFVLAECLHIWNWIDN